MTRTTGFEWNKFYNDKDVWTDDTYHDDTVLLVDGKQVDDFEAIPPGATVKIRQGMWSSTELIAKTHHPWNRCSSHGENGKKPARCVSSAQRTSVTRLSLL